MNEEGGGIVIHDKVKEVFAQAKEEHLKGQFLISDTILKEYLTFFLVAQKIRYGDVRVTANGIVENEPEPYSMRQYVLKLHKYSNIKEAEEDDMDEAIKAADKKYANRYNQLNTYTRKKKEERDDKNQVKKGLKEPIELFDFQKELGFLINEEDLYESEKFNSKEEKNAQTTLGQIRRGNFSKLRIPHLENVTDVLKKNVEVKNLTENEKQLHFYLIEKNISLEFTKAFCRTVAKNDIDLQKLDGLLYIMLLDLPSFQMREFYLQKVLDKNWRTEVMLEKSVIGHSEQLELFKLEVNSILNLVVHFIYMYIQKGYYNIAPTTEDYKIYTMHADYKNLIELNRLHSGEVAEQFNKLKEILNEIKS